MLPDRLARDLNAEIVKIPLIDPHSHIDPRSPIAKGLDDILGYHYFTELAHSAGMGKEVLAADVPARQRLRTILSHLDRLDNTVQYSWFVDIARSFLGFTGQRIRPEDCDALCDAAERVFGQADWEEQVFQRSNLEKIFLTNEFDDPLIGFDTERYVPCLRTDDLVFHLGKPTVRERLARATGFEATDIHSLARAVGVLFTHFQAKGARACAISLPPDFTPAAKYNLADFDRFLAELFDKGEGASYYAWVCVAQGVFTILAEHCRDFKLPFDLMIGVNRRVFPNGVHQGQDLFDQRTSLIQYAELFNAFPEVKFPVSVLTSSQNQELVSYAWIFPNVIVNGHWWYSNIPAYIAHDLRARLNAVPKTKLLGYYSDAYKLEFVLPKYNMYRRILAQTLADEYVRPGLMNETEAVSLARLLLRENTKRIFGV